MKYLNIIAFLLLLSSCTNTKQVVKNTTEETTEVAKVIIAETPKAEEPFQEIEETTKTTKEAIAEPKPDEIKIAEAFDHKPWNSLLQKHVSDKGNVSYKGFKKNRKTLTNYIASLGNNMPTKTWSKEDKLAYWINAYNALTIDLILRNYPLKSIKDIKDPWEQRFWKLGSKWYNLNQIEHKILRKMNEPRIHFGIVCASLSCPNLLNKAYTANGLESQLTQATIDFLKDSKRNNLSENNIKLSKIFKWFAKDFKTNGTLIDFLNKYSDINISNKATKSFKDYNWDLNE